MSNKILHTFPLISSHFSFVQDFHFVSITLSWSLKSSNPKIFSQAAKIASVMSSCFMSANHFCSALKFSCALLWLGKNRKTNVAHYNTATIVTALIPSLSISFNWNKWSWKFECNLFEDSNFSDYLA